MRDRVGPQRASVSRVRALLRDCENATDPQTAVEFVATVLGYERLAFTPRRWRRFVESKAGGRLRLILAGVAYAKGTKIDAK